MKKILFIVSFVVLVNLHATVRVNKCDRLWVQGHLSGGGGSLTAKNHIIGWDQRLVKGLVNPDRGFQGEYTCNNSYKFKELITDPKYTHPRCRGLENSKKSFFQSNNFRSLHNR